ncbi:unnamed protein product [Adineta ricciae]|uniref:Peptidase S1 domain-containing protein n=1 Tax=Adineta ricciae TaxID=249248 RepID=A0A815MV82_ADIRI|nr:unnamed protein product [Adineta ricciae]
MMPSTICLLVLALIGLINSAAINSGSKDVSYDVPIPRGYTREQYVKSVIDYWTSERMASAKPLHPTVSMSPKVFSVKDDEDIEVERVLTPSVASPQTRGANTPPAAGRAFFSMGGNTYVCSGSVVNAANRDTVVTAGHCVFNNTNKEWATNWIFVPDYDSKQRPFGTFVSRKLATKQQWKDKGDYNNDVAIVLLNTNEDGRHAQDLTGAFGITLSAPTSAATNAFGFPMNINSGETMSTCASSSKKQSLLLMSSFKGLQITCGMGGGASGGPWLQKYNSATKEGQQVSLTSFSYSLAPGKVHGPHFNIDNIGSLFQENQNA